MIYWPKLVTLQVGGEGRTRREIGIEASAAALASAGNPSAIECDVQCLDCLACLQRYTMAKLCITFSLMLGVHWL